LIPDIRDGLEPPIPIESIRFPARHGRPKAERERLSA